MSITSSAVLVEMNISVWQASVLDRSASDSVNAAHSAGNKASQVRKNLMAGTNQRKEIADYAGGCRLWHSSRTLPWSDKGPRLLPTSLFMEYKQEVNVRRATFNQMVADFIQNYPNHINDARTYMGGLFNAADYPTAEEVATKFGFRLVFSPVPESGDFRLDIPARELQEVQQGYEESFKERLADAMKEPWDRLHKVLTSISAKLTENDDPDKKKRYHDTLLSNAVELSDMLGHLNVTNDPQLEQARRMLNATLNLTDIETLKESPMMRESVKSKVDEILGKFSF